MTDDELLTHYILHQYGDPEQDEVRKLWKDTYGFKQYVLRVRWREFKEVVKNEFKKILPNN